VGARKRLRLIGIRDQVVLPIQMPGSSRHSRCFRCRKLLIASCRKRLARVETVSAVETACWRRGCSVDAGAVDDLNSFELFSGAFLVNQFPRRVYSVFGRWFQLQAC